MIKTLVLASNMNYQDTTLVAAELGLGTKDFGGSIMVVFCSGVCTVGDESIGFGSVGSGGYVFES